MKSFKFAALGALALSSFDLASGQVVIHFAASNGDRNATQRALSKILADWNYRGLDGSASGTGGQSQAITSVVQNSNFGTWQGKWNGQDVIVRTNYAGALAGVAAVADQTIEVRFDPTNGEGSGAIPANPLTATNPDHYVLSSVDFGLSTNFQATSPFNGDYNGRFYSDITQIPVGISPLGFYASPGFPVDNITTQQARQLYDAGFLPLSIFTGNTGQNGDPDDTKKYVFAIGRNTDAGQRFSAYQEVGRSGLGDAFNWNPTAPAANGNDGGGNPIYGDHADYDPEKSISPGGFVAGGIVNSHVPWATETHSGITSTGGYNSGANLAVALTYTLGLDAYKVYDPDAEAGYYIGYVTPGDANQRVLGEGLSLEERPAHTRGVQLKYNGIENTPENIKSGQYTLWLYNRIIHPAGGVLSKPEDPSPTFRGDFVQALTNQLIQVDGATGGGILLTDPDLKVERFEDGGPVIYK